MGGVKISCPKIDRKIGVLFVRLALLHNSTAIKLILGNLIDKILLYKYKQCLITGKSLCEYIYCRLKIDPFGRSLMLSDMSVF